MRQHGLALFVRPHNAQRARLLLPHRTLPATLPTLSPLCAVVMQVRSGRVNECDQTMFDKATYVLTA